MSRIDDLLSRPLRSKTQRSNDYDFNFGYYSESEDEFVDDRDNRYIKPDGLEPNQQYDEDNDYGYNDDDAEDAFSGRYTSFGSNNDYSYSSDDEDDSEEIGTDDLRDLSSLDDLDNLDDEDLAELDRELSGELEDEIDSEPEEELDSDAEMDADDMMSMAATTLLVNDELSSDEKKDFIANDADTAIREGFMTDADVNMIAESVEYNYFSEAKYNKPMLIRLDAESKKKQLYALAINVSAAANNDPDYRKLKKLMKLRKILRAKLAKKYHSSAIKRMKVYFNRLKKSKSPVLSNIAKKVEEK